MKENLDDSQVIGSGWRADYKCGEGEVEHPVLEQLYWISQISLSVIAVFAAWAAFIQVRSFKLSEMLRYIQSEEIRDARRIITREVPLKRGGIWWEDDRLERAASTVCSSYDVLGRMIENDWLDRRLGRWGIGAFFKYHWADSIVRTYEILLPFLDERRKTTRDAFRGYRWLYERALPYRSHSPPVGGRSAE